ncbi:MAG TPA: hypothetical protein DEH78_31770 [Solibacterales bacterium]|nr:hypothetical protein [Bryobacterales bacterium]
MAGEGEFCCDAHRLEYRERYDLRGLDKLLKKALREETPSGEDGGGSAVAVAAGPLMPVAGAAGAPVVGESIRALGEALRIQHELIEPDEESDEALPVEAPEAAAPRRARPVAVRWETRTQGFRPDWPAACALAMEAIRDSEYTALWIEQDLGTAPEVVAEETAAAVEEAKEEAPAEAGARPRRAGIARTQTRAARLAARAERTVRSVPPAALRLHVPRHTALPLRRRITLAPPGAAPAAGPVRAKRVPEREELEATALRPAVTVRVAEPPAAVAVPAEAAPAPPKAPTPAERPAPAVAPPLTAEPGTLVLPVETGGFFSRIPVAAWVGVVILGALLCGGYFVFKPGSVKRPQPMDTAVPAPVAMGGVAWFVESPQGTKARETGIQFSLYRPSLALSDYRMEFEGELEAKSLGWVIRYADPKNYYAMKIRASRPGDATGATFVRYAVIGGEETDRFELPLAAKVRPGMKIKVRVDAKGPRLITYVQGTAVNEWSDTKLKTGGFGFLNTREERARIAQVQLSFLKGASVQ